MARKNWFNSDKIFMFYLMKQIATEIIRRSINMPDIISSNDVITSLMVQERWLQCSHHDIL